MNPKFYAAIVLAPEDSTPTPSLLLSREATAINPLASRSIDLTNTQLYSNQKYFWPTTAGSAMNFIFKSKQRTPAELIKHLREAIHRLDAGGSASGGANSEGKKKVSRRRDLN